MIRKDGLCYGDNAVLSCGRYAALSVGGAAVALWIGVELDSGIRHTELPLRLAYCVDGRKPSYDRVFKDKGNDASYMV